MGWRTRKKVDCMKQLYRNRAVGSTAIFTTLRERYGITLSKQEMAMLCIISRGVPIRKELLIQGRELLVTRFISADPSDAVNLLSMAEVFNNEDDADFWLPFAENGLGGYYCLRFEQKAENSGVFWKNKDEMYKVAEDLKAFLQLLEIN